MRLDNGGVTGENRTKATTSKRRTFHQGVGGVVGLAAVGGLADRASAYHTYEDDYETVVDMREVGADPDGDEPINDLLREYSDDDTLLYFRSGRYRMNRQFRFIGFNNFDLLGSGATLVPDDYYDFDDGGDVNYRLFRLGISYNPGTDLLFENFTIDQTGSRRRRGLIIEGDDCMVYGGEYVVREFPIINYGDRMWIERIYANSTDNHEAIKLYESGDDMYVKKSRIIGGILNYGSGGLRTCGTTPRNKRVPERGIRFEPYDQTMATTPKQLDDNLASLGVELGDERLDRLDDVSAVELGFPHDFLSQSFVRTLVFSETKDKIRR